MAVDEWVHKTREEYYLRYQIIWDGPRREEWLEATKAMITAQIEESIKDGFEPKKFVTASFDYDMGTGLGLSGTRYGEKYRMGWKYPDYIAEHLEHTVSKWAEKRRREK